MSSSRLLVLNPNSVTAVTASIAEAIEPLHAGLQLECSTLTSGPRFIISQADVDGLTRPLIEAVGKAHEQAPIGALVVACFSDPGVQALREVFGFPVFGIGESAYLSAVPLAERFGVISIATPGVARHRRQITALGLAPRLAADLALDLNADEFADTDKRFRRLVTVGTRLRDAHGAGVIILGCAGLSAERAALQRELGVRVIDSVQAAVAQALGVLLPEQHTRPVLA